jgi:hypothetical protein
MRCGARGRWCWPARRIRDSSAARIAERSGSRFLSTPPPMCAICGWAATVARLLWQQLPAAACCARPTAARPGHWLGPTSTAPFSTAWRHPATPSIWARRIAGCGVRWTMGRPGPLPVRSAALARCRWPHPRRRWPTPARSTTGCSRPATAAQAGSRSALRARPCVRWRWTRATARWCGPACWARGSIAAPTAARAGSQPAAGWAPPMSSPCW